MQRNLSKDTIKAIIFALEKVVDGGVSSDEHADPQKLMQDAHAALKVMEELEMAAASMTTDKTGKLTIYEYRDVLHEILVGKSRLPRKYQPPLDAAFYKLIGHVAALEAGCAK